MNKPSGEPTTFTVGMYAYLNKESKPKHFRFDFASGDINKEDANIRLLSLKVLF